ncbi:MAG: hypothetical protein KDN05_17490, partial [Verrucomicrobiae bacterium]|nr:hypothetical protein [Verrucomicrobiae bacterium]
FANTASPATTVTFDQSGSYVLRLTATNGNASTAADLTVEAALPLPDVSILNPPAPVTLANAADVLRLTASATSNGAPDAPVVAWTQLSGPGNVIFANAAEPDTKAAFSAPGTYVLRCTATTSGGSASADATVSVATPAEITFREGVGGYSHAATFIRADSRSWNSGARDQILVGKLIGGNPLRAVFSFPLTGIPAGVTVNHVTLDLWTDAGAGTGTVGALELRKLSGTPVEGTGTGTNSADGAGTGATWLRRTDSLAWTSAGGDFETTVLSTVPGFPATATNVRKTFPSTSSLVSAFQDASGSGQPLNLMVISPGSESGEGSLFTRISSDDSPLTGQRPLLTVGWAAGAAPAVDPGNAPSAINGQPADLTGSAPGATALQWSLVSGPGSATFANPALAATTVTFDQAGTYVLQLAAANANAEVSRTLTVDVSANPGIFSDWQSLTWPGVSDPEIIGPGKDPDGDGLVNLLEWALHLDPAGNDRFDPELVLAGGSIEFRYTRRKIAPGEATFVVQWSDTLGDDWSDAGVVVYAPVSLDETSESVRVSLPKGPNGRRFVRVEVRSHD